MSTKLVPKIILKGTRLTFKTGIAFALNEHPRIVGPRKYKYHSPILLGVCAALIGAMTAGVVDHYFFNLDFPHSVTLFWMFVGLGVTTIQFSKRGMKTE